MDDLKFNAYRQLAIRGRTLINKSYQDPEKAKAETMTRKIEALDEKIRATDDRQFRLGLRVDRQKMTWERSYYQRHSIHVDVEGCKNNIRIYLKELNSRQHSKISLEEFLKQTT